MLAASQRAVVRVGSGPLVLLPGIGKLDCYGHYYNVSTENSQIDRGYSALKSSYGSRWSDSPLVPFLTTLLTILFSERIL